MFELINNYSVVLLEVICNRIYGSALFPGKPGITKRKSLYLFLLQSAAYLGAGYLFSSNIIVRELLVLVITAGIMFVLKEGKIWHFFLASGFFILLLFFVDLMTLWMIDALFDQFDINNIGNTMAGRFIVVIDKTLLLLLVLSMKRKADRKRGQGLAEVEWVRFVFFPVFTVLVSLAICVEFSDIQNSRQANVLYVTVFGMVLLNAFVYYLINDIIEREDELKEKEGEYRQFKNQINMYHTMRESLERQKERAHEYKNHILCVDALAKEKKYPELEQYISGIRDSFYMERNAIDTNNVIVNTILNEKYYEMMNKGIVFVFRINDLSSIKIGDEDLVVILSNLLDNAIEACQKQEGKKIIKLKFMTDEDGVILSVKNTHSGLMGMDQGQFYTTKTMRREEHGIGIKNIKRVIEKYGGTYSIKMDEKEFYFAILFPLKESTL